MLQQTQIARVEPAWRSFLDRFPTLEALAAAAPADVLRAWAGLGYNRRAVLLQRAARTVVAEFGGRVPASVEALERLPGVGPYTARAVAAIAFGIPVAAVDTNVRRVLRRVTGEGRVTGEAPTSGVQAQGDRLVDRARPADWTHALMDVGSTLCRPRRPACAACPLGSWCVHATAGTGQGRVTGGADRPSPRPFEGTSRWLRGRIVEALREAEPGAWVALPGKIGVHDAEAIREATTALERDGILEHDQRGRTRLPVA
jgi:A/G-specific adenine glycosylase